MNTREEALDAARKYALKTYRVQVAYEFHGFWTFGDYLVKAWEHTSNKDTALFVLQDGFVLGIVV